MVKDEKLYHLWGSLKNPTFKWGFTKNQCKGGNCLKRWAWTVCKFKGGTWQERGGGALMGVDTLMHTMIILRTHGKELFNVPTVLSLYNGDTITNPCDIANTGLSVNILRGGDKSPVQKHFFKNSIGDLLPGLRFLGGLYNFCNFAIILPLM